MCQHVPLFCVVPPHMLREIANRARAEEHRAFALRALELSAQMRGRRTAFALLPQLELSTGTKRRAIYTCNHGIDLPGTLVRGESEPPTSDESVNRAYDGLGDTYDFYMSVLQRNSIDGRGMRLNASVHFDNSYDNAFWDGRQMVFGDGDGQIFNDFTGCLDVIGHELAHGVTQFTAKLEYQDQSGALNESMSDVFGSLIKQYKLGQTADQANWLIGEGLLAPGIHGDALRSMKAPGTAYDDPTIGKDPQPPDMANYVNTPEDNGGVHINSSIPNRAFYLTASAIGGYAWEKAGRIWYCALTQKLHHNSDFSDVARATYEAAGTLYGNGSAEQTAVARAWDTVGVSRTAGRAAKAA
jgi:Zn-dependent metalloprotease